MNVYQLKVKLLQDCEPKIWRRIIVWESITFEQLHLIILTIFGCKTDNKWHFGYENSDFSISIPNPETSDNMPEEDASSAKIKDFINVYHPKMIFCQSADKARTFELCLERIIDDAMPDQLPACIDGSGCLPQECSEHKGCTIDSDKIDVGEINKRLLRLVAGV